MAKTKKDLKTDIIIAGGGLAGLTQAILLAKEGFSVVCIDREKPVTQLDAAYDTRTTAISWGSRNVLRRADIWDVMEDKACPIRDIRILDGGSPFALKFLSEDVEGREFGWIVDNLDLRKALHAQAEKEENLTHLTGEAIADYALEEESVTAFLASGARIEGQLVIGCDGRKSFTREWMKIGTYGHDYGQTALVAIVQHERPHDNVAIEHFLPAGPFASLPMTDGKDGQNRSAIVWSIEERDAQKWMSCREEIFNAKLNSLYKGIFGKAKLVGRRAGWPLNVCVAYSYIAPRMALMAEAAHGIHPIAGQGLNISLRDVAAMTEILGKARDSGETDFGADALLKEYQAKRRFDNTAMSFAMEGFNGLFSNDIGPLRIARQLGLRAISKIPAAKRFFMTQAMGTVGHVPDMVKDAQNNQMDKEGQKKARTGRKTG